MKFKKGDRVVCVDASGTDIVLAGKEYTVTDSKNGFLYGDWESDCGGMFAYRFRLVSPSTNIGAQVDTLADEYGPAVVASETAAMKPVASEPKFKVGDRVKYKDERTSGDGVIHSSAPVEEGSCQKWLVKVADKDLEWAYYVGNTCREYMPHSLELVSTPAIVALINGTPKPSTSPKVHASTESATAESERLALLHPGQEFGVFVLTDSKIADVVQTAVLRAA